MDINSVEAKTLGQRVADGCMEFVPNGIRDRQKRQVYGITTQKRFYRFDEDTASYNILAKSRDRFEMVRGLNAGESPAQDNTFTNLTLLPDKTFYENLTERYVPQLFFHAWRMAINSTILGGAGYLLLHANDIFAAFHAIFAGNHSAHIGAQGATQAACEMHRAANVHTQPSRVGVCDPFPSETGWRSALDRVPLPSVGASGLAGPVAAGIGVGAAAGYAAYASSTSQQHSQASSPQNSGV